MEATKPSADSVIDHHRSCAKKHSASEIASWLAGESHSDYPECVSVVVATLIREWNNALADSDRTRLLLPLLPAILHTRASDALEWVRGMQAADWVVRSFLPTWLESAVLMDEAGLLQTLPELREAADITLAQSTLDDVYRRAHAAYDVVGTPMREAKGQASRELSMSAIVVRRRAWTAAAKAARAGASSKTLTAAVAYRKAHERVALFEAIEAAARTAVGETAGYAALEAAGTAAWELAGNHAWHRAAKSAGERKDARRAGWDAAAKTVELIAWSNLYPGARQTAQVAATISAWNAAGTCSSDSEAIEAATRRLQSAVFTLHVSAVDLIRRLIMIRN
jgi:hypothetical protein